MSTAQTLRIDSSSYDETLAIASDIGRKLRGGEVIELISDLGGGKTAFVQGLASGLGSKDPVRSPSFTLGNQYKAGELTLYHFDFYRLNEPGIMRDELAEVIGDPKAIVAVEWGEIVKDVLPAECISIGIKAVANDEREIIITYADKYKYIFNS